MPVVARKVRGGPASRPVAALAAALLLAASSAQADDAAVAAPPTGTPPPLAASAPSAAPPVPATPRAHLHEGVMLGGIVGTILGSFLLIPGVWLASNGLARAGGPADPGSRWGVLAVGGGIVVAGVTMAAVGGSPPPALPRVALGPRAASLAWTF